MLPDEGEAGLPGPGEEVPAGHLVLGGRPDGQRPPVEVDVHEPAAGREPARELPEVARPGGQVVEGIHDEDEVAAGWRERGPGARHQGGANVLDPGGPHPRPQRANHPRLDVEGVDGAPPAHRSGEPQGEVSRPGPEVADGGAGPEAEGRENAVRLLPGGPVLALEEPEVVGEVLGVPVAIEGAAPVSGVPRAADLPGGGTHGRSLPRSAVAAATRARTAAAGSAAASQARMAATP